MTINIEASDEVLAEIIRDPNLLQVWMALNVYKGQSVRNLSRITNIHRRTIDRCIDKLNELKTSITTAKSADPEPKKLTNSDGNATDEEVEELMLVMENAQLNIDGTRELPKLTKRATVMTVAERKAYNQLILKNTNPREIGYGGFVHWIDANAPYVINHLILPTPEEFMKLKAKVDSTQLKQIIEDIENNDKSRKNAFTVYNLCLKFINYRKKLA